MLKTNLICKAKSLIPAVLIAGLGVLSSHQAANAATFNFVNIATSPSNPAQPIYNYNLFIAPGEGISILDAVNISGVTAGDFFTAPTGFAGSKPSQNQVSFVYIDGSDPANAQPILGGANGRTISGFQILGNAGSETGNGTFQFADRNFGNTGGTTISGTGSVFVPVAVTAVPEASNALGLMLIGGIAAASGLRKQLIKS